ncbi:MAG: hypothetical protein J6L81_07440 [Clostridia bacterium]|nr:hypothetical protein [Clostridia bacterium]
MPENKEKKETALAPVKKDNTEIAKKTADKDTKSDKSGTNNENMKSGIIIASMIILIILIIVVIILIPQCQQKSPVGPSASAGAPVISTSDVEAGETGSLLSIRTSADSFSTGDTIVFTAAIENRSSKYLALRARASDGSETSVLNLSVTADGCELEQSNISTQPVSASDCYFLLAPHESIQKIFIYKCSADVGGVPTPLWQTELNATLTVDIGPSLVKKQSGLETLTYQEFTNTEKVRFFSVQPKPAGL